MPIASINPANNRLIRTFDPLTEEATRQKISLADEAFHACATVPLEHRALWMRKLAAILENETDELAATITVEMGKPIHAARQEVLKCATACRYYADNAARILAPESIPTGDRHSYVRYDPLGVILAVMPWNFPFWQVFRFLAPALMAGNTGLLKHASNVPQCALTIESLVRRAGFPRGTFQTLLIEARHVEHVLGDPRIAAVTLTGSEPAGRAVAAQAGWLIKKSVLELGGSDPFIVLPSADLDLSVETAVRARLVNTGQSCIAANRIYVQSGIYDRFVSAFVARVKAMKVGNGLDAGVEIGPLVNESGLRGALAQIEDAVRRGGKVLCGGKRIDGKGFFLEPTVIANLHVESACMHEETFAPIAPLVRFENEADAIAQANASVYGLSAYAFTRDLDRTFRLMENLEAGTIGINDGVPTTSVAPFGGVKQSGWGRELGIEGLEEFLETKHVSIAMGS